MEQQQKLAPIYPNDPQEVRIEKRRINVRMNSERFAFDLRAQHTFQSDEALINMMAQDAFLANAGLLEETEEERQARLNAMRTKTEVLWSVLLQGRLRYLEGILNGDRAASWFYQKSRPSAAEMAQMEDEAAAQTQVLLKVIQNSAESDANRRAASLQRQYLERMLPGKRDSRELATYWLGLLHFQKQSYGEAVVYFSERFLDDPDYADSELVPMARYNLARSLEKFAEAKQSQVSKAAPEEQEALRQEVKEMQQRALDYYENETEPLFVPQARARGVWYRKQLDAGEGS